MYSRKLWPEILTLEDVPQGIRQPLQEAGDNSITKARTGNLSRKLLRTHPAVSHRHPHGEDEGFQGFLANAASAIYMSHGGWPESHLPWGTPVADAPGHSEMRAFKPPARSH